MQPCPAHRPVTAMGGDGGNNPPKPRLITFRSQTTLSRWNDAPAQSSSELHLWWVPQAKLTGTVVQPARNETVPRRNDPIWRVLVATGDPGANNNRFDREVASMREQLPADTLIETSSVSCTGLERQLSHHQPAVLHLSAHSDGDQVALHAGGAICWTPFSTLAASARMATARPLLVVLNVCASTRLESHFKDWSGTTLIWRDEIDDEAMRRFSVSFYLSLARARSVMEAATTACADTPALELEQLGIAGNGALRLPRLMW